MKQTLLNPEQAAAILGVTRPGFVKMYKRGAIPAEVVVGRQAFFTTSAVKTLARCRKKAAMKNGAKKK